MVCEVDHEAVESIRNRGAGCAPGRVVGPEHEMIYEELRAPSEELGERRLALIRFESILLVDPDPGQLRRPPGELVTATGDLLFVLQQLDAGGEPLFARPHGVPV